MVLRCLLGKILLSGPTALRLLCQFVPSLELDSDWLIHFLLIGLVRLGRPGYFYLREGVRFGFPFFEAPRNVLAFRRLIKRF